MRAVPRVWCGNRRDCECDGAPRASLDLTVGDIDGDGEREVAILGAGGRVTLWSPDRGDGAEPTQVGIQNWV